MARSEIPMVINLRQNRNDESSAYGKYFPKVDSKEPLNLKGLAAHMADIYFLLPNMILTPNGTEKVVE